MLLLTTIVSVLALFPNDSALLTVPVAHAAALEAPLTPQAYIEQQARLYNVSVPLALYVAGHESPGFIATSTGDMNIICRSGPNRGKPVRAKGNWQITDCYHAEVTDAQAFDLTWSTAWAMPILKNPVTCKHEFSTCRDYYAQVHEE